MFFLLIREPGLFSHIAWKIKGPPKLKLKKLFIWPHYLSFAYILQHKQEKKDGLCDQEIRFMKFQSFVQLARWTTSKMHFAHVIL
mmetsp:Transcript_21976/g.44081  ORF Transcript_21976/g.44081 Transcript_21976/m.44081 type:complete len:85 (+) Transcript_21976:257-511(+)